MSAWREELLTAAEMRAVEADYAGPTLELMERAGRACAEACVATFPGVRLWAVHCGGGANGGDGLVAARHLVRQGRRVDVVLHADPGRLRGDAAENYRRALDLGLTVRGVDEPEPSGPADGAIDALLGTGFEGPLRAGAAQVIARINDVAGPTVSVDVPSGVDASTGEVPGEAVRADLTVTFHRRKVAHAVAPAAPLAGAVDVAGIGLAEHGTTVGVLPGTDQPSRVAGVRDSIVSELPVRGRADNKYSAGFVVVVGGSRGLTGAPGLASLAALRSGAGLVVACVPSSLNTVFEAQTLEVMTRPCDDLDGALTREACDDVLAAAARAGAVAIGPGLGRAETTAELVHELLARLAVPVVLDADGLWPLNGRLDVLARRAEPTVLTPHAGELGRLLGISSAAIGEQRLASAQRAADDSGAVVALKGADTIVAAPQRLGGEVLVSEQGTPGLATAGSGDVLTGVVAACLAKGVDPLRAAATGAALTGLASRAAGATIGAPGLIASDVVHALPSVIADASARAPS